MPFVLVHLHLVIPAVLNSVSHKTICEQVVLFWTFTITDTLRIFAVLSVERAFEIFPASIVEISPEMGNVLPKIPYCYGVFFT